MTPELCVKTHSARRIRLWSGAGHMVRRLAVLSFVLVVLAPLARAGVPTVLANFVVRTSLEPLSAPLDGASADATPGVMTLDTVPWSKVVIDGEVRGTTPLFRVKLMPGQHTVRFLNDGAGLAYETQVNVKGGYLTKVKGEAAAAEGEPAVWAAERPTEVAGGTAELTQPAFVSVDSEPWAKVSVDGQVLGSTPVFRARIAPGRHVLTLVREDGIETLPIDVEAGQVLRVKTWPGLGLKPELLVER